MNTLNAGAHLDGFIDCATLQIGILRAGKTETPVVKFLVTSGVQQHPVWVMERLAAVVYCYCQATIQVAAETMPPEDPRRVDVSVFANLVSGEALAALVAHDIRWHTSKAIRDLAEPMIARMTGDSARWKIRWPSDVPLEFPVKR